MKISVIIPVFNGGEHLQACLQSILRAEPPADEVIVVSDASTDQSETIALSAGVRMIRLPVNGGASRARNAGAEAASGAILLFLDADVTIPPQLIAQVHATFAASDAPDAVFGSYDDAPAARGLVSQYRNLLHHFVHQTSHSEASTFWGGCGAVRREVFWRVGGFPEERRYLEDVEFGYQMTLAGFCIRLEQTLQVKHLKRWTLSSMLHTDILHRALPWTDLLLRYGQVANDMNLRHTSRLSLLLLAALPVLIGMGTLVPGLRAANTGGVALCGIGLLALNAPLYRFFWHKRGPLFTLGAVPLHWLYYGCGAVGLLLGLLQNHASTKRKVVDVA